MVKPEGPTRPGKNANSRPDDTDGSIQARLYKMAMNMYRDDIAEELGLADKVSRVGWSGMTAKECGKIGGKMGGKLGGNMVRKMIQMAKKQMAQGEVPAKQKKEAPEKMAPDTQNPDNDQKI